ncbi:MAG TPA: hypothetical protein VKE41_03740 [Roseiflexaceae bacterium]|nr:hypothetical protein [Roseiflexaceae bacterium]
MAAPRRARLIWTICSYLGLLGFTVLHQMGYAVKAGDFVMWLLYLPALACLFWPKPRLVGQPAGGAEEQPFVP